MLHFSKSFFIGNPQITFFKVVYRRHTNFRIESHRILMNGDDISDMDYSRIYATIPKWGDLITDIFFSFDLPNIYSGSYNVRLDDNKNVPYEFRWVENIGLNMINEVSLFFSNKVIQTFNGNSLQILSELRHNESNKKIHNELIGNVVEIYNPSLFNIDKFKQNKNTFISIITNEGSGYPSSSIISYNNCTFRITAVSGKLKEVIILGNHQDFIDGITLSISGGTGGTIKLHHSTYPHIRGTITNQHEIHTTNSVQTIYTHDLTIDKAKIFIPSIHKRNIKVPLNFFCSKSYGTPIPCIILDNTEISVDIILNRISNIYTILDYNNNQVIRRKPHIPINRFIYESNLNILPYLEVEYIYLDEEERSRMKSSSHNYLIEEVFIHPQIVNITTNKEHKLYLKQHVKELLIVSKRNDMESINNWNNYTNWTLENIPPYSFRYNNFENMYYDNNTQTNIFYNRYPENNNRNIEYYLKYFNENIIDYIELIIDGSPYQKKYDSSYFNMVVPYKYYDRKIKKGIHIFSFSLKPNKHEPSGSLNFNDINKCSIKIDVENINEKEIPKLNNEEYFKYNFDIYAIYYNILEFKNGVCKKKYNY